MKIIVSPNAFKGSLSAIDAVKVIERGIKAVSPDCEIASLPVSDGGDGFLQALAHGFHFCEHFTEVSNPLGQKIQSKFLYSVKDNVAVIEMAASSGLALLSEQEKNKTLQPMQASTFGFGELIIAALNLGARHFILGIGGSATNDGGTGMATTLGVRFLDENKKELAGNAENLLKISHIDMSNIDGRFKNCVIEVASDVNNVLLGEHGAARVYGPQKGASQDQVLLIEAGLKNLANVIERDLNVNVLGLVGGGAAGGLGAGLFAFVDAKLKPGAELLLDMQQFELMLKDADLVITTEGKLDAQTYFGKAPFVVASRAKKKNVPTIIIGGQVALDVSALNDSVFLKAYELCGDRVSVDYAIAHVEELLFEKTKEAVKDFIGL